MDEVKLVLAAKNGDTNAFERLVIKYHRKMYGYAVNKLKRKDDAEEILQETFLKAFTKLDTLRNPEFFSAWIFRICSNLIYSRFRENNKEVVTDNGLLQEIEDEREAYSEWQVYSDFIRIAINFLDDKHKAVIQLCYFVGLSYKDIAKKCKIPVNLVKSRIYEAKQKIKSMMPKLFKSIELKPFELKYYREKIMKTIELVKIAASVMVRLSLNEQVKIANLSQQQKKFDEELIKEINKVEFGTNFVMGYDAKLDLRDLVDIINYYDRASEARLIWQLEKVNPEFCEEIKRNLFVFEDFIMFQAEAMRFIIDNVDRKTFVLALVDCQPELKNFLLSTFTEEEKSEINNELNNLKFQNMENVKNAQMQLIEITKKLEREHKIIANRPSDESILNVFRLIK